MEDPTACWSLFLFFFFSVSHPTHAPLLADTGQAKRLEASDRERREQADNENASSLVKVLEEMEREQSGVLSAALQRSDAALGEVARVKEVRGPITLVVFQAGLSVVFHVIYFFR